MSDTKELFGLINQLWAYIRDHNGMISDNEDTWQKLMDDADQILLQVTDIQQRNLLSKWLVAYLAYVDRREGRILHDDIHDDNKG